MKPSSAVCRFIQSIPSDALYVDRLWELTRAANCLIASEPNLVVPLSVIRNGFDALARHWEDEPISPEVSAAITPPVREAAEQALMHPSDTTLTSLTKTMEWARNYPLISGVKDDSIEKPWFPGGTPRL